MKSGGGGAPAPRLTMRESTQRKILDEIIGNKASAGKWKVLILDDATTRIVSSSLTMFDIMENNVSLVENLAKGRQPFPDLDAVYFITPSMKSAKKVMGDFVSRTRAAEMPPVDGKPVVPVQRYADVHLIFNGSVDDKIMELFQTNALLISKVKTFKEVQIEYLAPEANVFHLDDTAGLSKIFGDGADTNYAEVLGRKIATMCISLNEHPNLRYQAASPIARLIADSVHRTIQNYKRLNSTFRPNGDGDTDRERGQLLILDRAVDPLSPLMHEYSYQAMANDLLDVATDGTVTYSTTTEGGRTQEKQVLLNSEMDEQWKELRHKHIAKVIASVKERMNDIISTNGTAKRKGKKGGSEEAMDMSSMADAVKDLPAYRETMSNLGRHVNIAQQCMNQFGAQGLMEISAIEQIMATGTNEDNEEVKGKKVVEALLPHLQNRKTRKDIKLRLLCIYKISQRPISRSDLGQLVQAAGLTPEDQAVLENVERLMGPLDGAGSTSSTPSGGAKGGGGGGGGGFFSRLLGGFKQPERIEATAEGEYIDTRHVCQLKGLVEQMINAQLPTDKYPTMGPSIPQSSESKSTAQSVRKYKATDRWGGKSQNQVSGGRYMCFIAGGISYAEMCEASELMAKENKEVVVGSTHIVTPSAYIEEIAGLTTSDS